VQVYHTVHTYIEKGCFDRLQIATFLLDWKEETMMRLQKLLFFVLVLTVNTAAHDLDITDDVIPQDEVASEIPIEAPIETASTEEEKVEEAPVGGTDSLNQEDSSATMDAATGGSTTGDVEAPAAPPVQTGPLIDLFGPTLLSLEMIDEQHAQLTANYTSDGLRGKKVIGVYFSADWCGPW
jgi:hypothetical protein